MRVIKEENKVELTPEQVINNPSLLQAKKTGIVLDKSLLPSNGVFYPDEIRITPFTGMDLKDITNVDENTVNQTIYKILNRRVQGINTNDILVNDKLWFIYYIRDITYKGSPIKIKCTCPHCGQQTIQEYTFDKLNVIHYDNKLPDKQLKLPNEDLIEFTFPTIGVENQIARLKNNPANFEPIDDQFMLIASYIKSINGKRLNIWDAYNYAKNADALTFCFIINKLDDAAFMCDRTGKFTCVCGEELNPVIEFTKEFFIPKLY